MRLSNDMRLLGDPEKSGWIAKCSSWRLQDNSNVFSPGGAKMKTTLKADIDIAVALQILDI